MRLRRRRFDARLVFAPVTVVLLVVYLVIGLSPARAADYEIDGAVEIPNIGLKVNVTDLTLVDGELKTPDTIAGSYSRVENKTLLIGHSTTAFARLDEVDLGDEIYYEGSAYKVTEIEMLRKSDISMNKILKSEDTDTLVLMTCAGTLLDGGDATHRLIITAKKN